MKDWWQLKRIWFGFVIIIIVIAFGIAQPSLWYLFDKNPPNTVIETSNLLLIVITLLAVGLTGFSVLIYEALQERLKVRVAEVEKEALSHIEEHVDNAIKKHQKLSEETEKKAENRQTTFRAQMLRHIGYTFWQLFIVWVEVKGENAPHDSSVKQVSRHLIKVAIMMAKRSLGFAKELPEDEYKTDIYRCKNNWVYFLAEASRTNSDEVTKEDKDQALKFVNEILAEVSKQDYHDDYFEFQESGAWALQHLSETGDKISEQKTSDIIRKLLNDEDIDNINPSWRRETKIKWQKILDEKNNTSASVENA